jgi:hypothetical protein
MELAFLIAFFVIFLAAAFTGGKKQNRRSYHSSHSFTPFAYEKDHDNDSSYTSWSDSDSGNGGDSSGD